MGHRSHGNEVEESISTPKSKESEVPGSLDEPIVISEGSREPCGGNEEAEERRYELGVENKGGDLKEALKGSSQQINKPNENLISSGDDESASECIANTSTTVSEQSGMDQAAEGMQEKRGAIEATQLGGAPRKNTEAEEMELQNQCCDSGEEPRGSPQDLNGELEVESQQTSKVTPESLILDTRLLDPKEAELFKISVAVTRKRRKYLETISNLRAESESLKAEHSRLAKELEVAEDTESAFDEIVKGLKEDVSTLNSRSMARNETQLKYEEDVHVFKSLKEKISHARELLGQLNNENTALKQQVKASQENFLYHREAFNNEKSKEIEDIVNQKRKIEEERVKLENLERQRKQSRDKHDEAQELSKKKEQEIELAERTHRGVRSLYNGDIRDLTNGCALMKAYIEDAKEEFDKKMDSLEDNLQMIEAKISERSKELQMVKMWKEKQNGEHEKQNGEEE